MGAAGGERGGNLQTVSYLQPTLLHACMQWLHTRDTWILVIYLSETQSYHKKYQKFAADCGVQFMNNGQSLLVIQAQRSWITGGKNMYESSYR